MKLYHYSEIDVQEIELDPKYFGKHIVTRNDQRSSTIPRLFFYAHAECKERILVANNLYVSEIPEAELFDLNNEVLKTALIEDIHKEKRKEYKHALLPTPDEMLKEIIHRGYNGVMYDECPIIALFIPIFAKRVSEANFKEVLRRIEISRKK